MLASPTTHCSSLWSHSRNQAPCPGQCSSALPQVFTQLALILLLWGTMCGGLALISDVAVILTDRLAAIEGSWALPHWVNGRSCMAAVALLVLFPLCLQRHMREVRLCVMLARCCLQEQLA